MHSFLAFVCWAVMVFLMVIVGRMYHYHDSTAESYGQAVGRRVITSVLILLMFALLLGGLGLWMGFFAD